MFSKKDFAPSNDPFDTEPFYREKWYKHKRWELSFDKLKAADVFKRLEHYKR